MSIISQSDDKLLLSKAEDVIYLSEKRNTPCFLGFLTSHEKQVIIDNIHGIDETCFYGGYENAERTIFGANAESTDDFPIVPVEFTYRECDILSHRDFLGAMMSLGITRESIGDILVNKGRAVAFVKHDIADFVLSQIDKVGSKGVKVSKFLGDDLPLSENFEMLEFSVASLRLDVIISAVCSLSRDKSTKLITAENVSVNHYIQTNVSKTLQEGDCFTIRKYGKFVFTEILGYTKKGRIRISVKHFR